VCRSCVVRVSFVCSYAGCRMCRSCVVRVSFLGPQGHPRQARPERPPSAAPGGWVGAPPDRGVGCTPGTCQTDRVGQGKSGVSIMVVGSPPQLFVVLPKDQPLQPIREGARLQFMDEVRSRRARGAEFIRQERQLPELLWEHTRL
jgi:hypothetical protein